MITRDARRSLSRGNNPVPSPWQATGGRRSAAGSAAGACRVGGGVSSVRRVGATGVGGWAVFSGLLFPCLGRTAGRGAKTGCLNTEPPGLD
jgi:hypothetical protein